MSHQAKVIAGGKLALPADLRRLHGIKDGDRLVVDEHDGAIRVRTYLEVVREVQAHFRSHAPRDGSVADELIAERRAEAAKEDAESDRLLAARK